MKLISNRSFILPAVIATLSACVTGAHGSVSMQIVADNDFAMFVGTNNDVTGLVYQNNVGWPDQLANLSQFSFNLQPGQTTFYLLGMGGGGAENISGTVNGVDLSKINVSMSSDIGPYLTGYEDQTVGGGVAAGTFNATLVDVQAAQQYLTWGSPTPTNPDADYVATQSPSGQGFHFDSDTAHLFKFSAADVDVVTPTPEPSTFLLSIGAALAFALSRLRTSPHRV